MTVDTRTGAHPDADATVPDLETDLPAVGSDAAVDAAFADLVDATVDVEIGC